jgi:NAD(P)-dependent dehydrogenase (short-subunit alcohol dehydrogenase family)
MGFATARAMLEEGGKVAIIGRDEARMQASLATLRAAHGGRVVGFATRAAPSESLASTLQQVIEGFGGLDGLAVTAGPIARQAEFTQLTDEDWAESFETQVMTVVRAVRSVLPALIEARGSIVTTAAYSVRSPKALLAHYSAMKSAVAALTKSIAKAYGPEGVRANCVAPGVIDTEALVPARRAAVQAYGGDEDQALGRLMKEAWGMAVALGRVGRPEEVAHLIAFLLSDRSRYLTGALINIDGGTDF